MKQLKISAAAAGLLLLVLNLGCRKDSLTDSTITGDSGSLSSERSTVVVPAGSVDQLAAALASATTVILAPGTHTETGTVLVSGFHNIIGQSGAVLRLTARPDTALLPMQPGLHFKNASNSMISNVRIEGANELPGCAILVENSTKATVQNCHITGFQFSILVEKSPQVSLFKNRIESSTAWQTGALPIAHGIVVINGEGARAEQNEISGAFFGFWACDHNGIYRKNFTHDNMVGLILCKVPTPSFILPDGTLTGAQSSAVKWLVQNNTSTGNYDNGIMVIDGATENKVIANDAHGNGLAPLFGSAADIEVFSDSYLFGFLTPSAQGNVINSTAYPQTTIKNCGANTTVTGGTVWNTGAYPCR